MRMRSSALASAMTVPSSTFVPYISKSQNIQAEALPPRPQQRTEAERMIDDPHRVAGRLVAAAGREGRVSHRTTGSVSASESRPCQNPCEVRRPTELQRAYLHQVIALQHPFHRLAGRSAGVSRARRWSLVAGHAAAAPDRGPARNCWRPVAGPAGRGPRRRRRPGPCADGRPGPCGRGYGPPMSAAAPCAGSAGHLVIDTGRDHFQELVQAFAVDLIELRLPAQRRQGQALPPAPFDRSRRSFSSSSSACVKRSRSGHSTVWPPCNAGGVNSRDLAAFRSSRTVA